MKILNFKGTGIHGYLDLCVDFDRPLTFVTGINGTGKTSALRAIVALLTPSITTLVGLQYEALEVKILHNGESIDVTSRRTDDDVFLACTGTKKELRIPILRKGAHELHSRFAEKEAEFYREQVAIHRVHEVIARLSSIPTPMFLDLDRRHQDTGRFRRDARPEALSGNFIDSVRDALGLAEDTYRRFVIQKTVLAERLKRDVILTLFRPGKRITGPSPWLKKQAYLKKLMANQQILQPTLIEVGLSPQDVNEIVGPFFERAVALLDSLPTQKTLQRKNLYADQEVVNRLIEWGRIEPAVERMELLVPLIEAYNAEVRKHFVPISRYLDTVNSFLQDSGKNLFFSNNQSLRVSIPAKEGSLPSIAGLSSGEKQLVVILTHLYFSQRAREANVLIIDEPELSLHIRWQEMFVSALAGSSPGLQLILATHSPSIILDRESDCISLTPKKGEIA